MSLRYIGVNWNRQKRIYDTLVGAAILACVGVFAGITAWVHPDATIETRLIRGFGLTAFLLLHFILIIGPLARIDDRFLPLLYNRRHLGVTLGILALGHAGFSVVQYHGDGNVDPLVSVLVSNREFGTLAGFPFELFGILALVILLLMAATSHDYWLATLTPPVWKRLHMLVYLAYVALVAHVGLGFLQAERHLIYSIALGIGVVLVAGLHLAAALRERPGDRDLNAELGWVDVCDANSIAEGRATIGTVAGERVAVFRHQGKLSCVSNVCKHQNGPLGEGRIIDGCVTCPWHGYQYQPETGASPPPFSDSIPTFNLRMAGGRVLVHERPNPPGTYVEPVPVEVERRVPHGEGRDADFYVGYLSKAPDRLARFVRIVVVSALLLSGGLMAVFAVVQRSYGPQTFEFGQPTLVEGTVRTAPYPLLEVNRPGNAQGSVSRYLLAAAGKHGAQALVRELDGRRVRIEGMLAYRGNVTLLSLVGKASLSDTALAAVPAPPSDLGTFDLTGAIEDSKCYLGVMNPGDGKTHRACAARCLSGGLTPLFVVRNPDGSSLEMILVKGNGAPLGEAPAWAGRPVSLRGRVLQHGDLWLLSVDPASVRAVP